MCFFFSLQVAQNSDVNKMTALNIGQTVGLAIFHDMGASNAANVLRFLILHRTEVFPWSEIKKI